MERGSDKTGPLRDDELKEETEGMFRAGRQTHAEEWRQLEPSGEDEPEVDRAPETTLVGGTPGGMDPGDVEGRAELAAFLSKDIYPAVREQVIGAVVDGHAPDHVVDTVRRLPGGRTFGNVNEVWEALGGRVEGERF